MPYLLLTAVLVWLSFIGYTYLYKKYLYDYVIENKDFQLKVLRGELDYLRIQIEKEREDRQTMTLAYFKTPER